MNDLLGHVLTNGFPLDKSSIIHLFVGGSTLHGAKVEGYDDLDIYGCYVEPPDRILGIKTMEHFVWSSGSQAEKNTANDVDITMYSLHRWAELMMKGNPAILHYLYSPVYHLNTVWENHIVPLREQLLTKKAAKQYLGFANSQRMRLTGERGMGRHGQRPDLIEKYGYDVKFAMHYIRLLLECKELLTDKFLTLPSKKKNFLIEIRTGKFFQDEIFSIGKELMADCEILLEKSDLPENIDVHLLSNAVANAYREHWEMNNQ
jgi:predicted nucleotidyltransferase